MQSLKPSMKMKHHEDLIKWSVTFFPTFVLIFSFSAVFVSFAISSNTWEFNQEENGKLTETPQQVFQCSLPCLFLSHRSTLSASSFWFLCSFNIYFLNSFFLAIQLHKNFWLELFVLLPRESRFVIYSFFKLKLISCVFLNFIVIKKPFKVAVRLETNAIAMNCSIEWRFRNEITKKWNCVTWSSLEQCKYL